MAILHIRLSGQPLALCGTKHGAWAPADLAREAGVYSEKQGRWTTLPNTLPHPVTPTCAACSIILADIILAEVA